MRRSLILKGAGVATLVLGMTAAWPVLADLQVIQSNSAAYKEGAVYPDNTVFNLNAGERVQVLVLPAKVTKVFEGKGAHTYEPRGGSRSATGKKKEN